MKTRTFAIAAVSVLAVAVINPAFAASNSGIGVSGAPSGATDEACAKAGLATVQDDLEME
jgi:hypothetical protein